MKVLIIGLDGATWDVFDDFLLENHMPNLNRLKKNGCSGVLQSTYPPITPAAWTTCITGCQPYTHGVVGFREYSFKNNSLSISTAANCRVPNMFEELSEQGYKVASINVPWTYPCRKVNGYMVAGYGISSTQVSFTYPPDFKEELLEKIPDYNVMAEWDKSGNYDPDKFDANISRVERSFEQRLTTAKIINNKFSPDVMMVQFQDTDLIQHNIWSYLDKDTRDIYPSKRDRLFVMFEKLDQAIGRLLEFIDMKQIPVVVVSDHGLCRTVGKIRPNRFLYDWTYLKFQSPIRRMIRRCRRNLRSLLCGSKASMPIELKTPVDWKRSKAMVTYAALNGHIYLNVKGRNQHGCVQQGEEYNSIIRDLRHRFSEVKDPSTGAPIFSHVVTPAELYNCNLFDAEILGDLILVPKPGYIVHQSTARKASSIKLQPESSLSGCHCYDGIYIVCGPNIMNGKDKRTHIVDIAPMIYALLGAKLPKYLDGRVLEEMFIEKIRIIYQNKQIDFSHCAKDKHILSVQEEAEITKQLSALGYIE